MSCSDHASAMVFRCAHPGSHVMCFPVVRLIHLVVLPPQAALVAALQATATAAGAACKWKQQHQGRQRPGSASRRYALQPVAAGGGEPKQQGVELQEVAAHCH